MGTISRFLIVILALVLILGTEQASTQRKLPVGAYVKTAKIEILSGDFERYEYAIAMLDSLFMHYGPHAEGLYLMGQIMVDYIDKTSKLPEKAPYIEKMMAYFDSLKMCCDNKEIKKGYRKDCKKFSAIADSLVGRYWHDFYISGRDQLKAAEELGNQLKTETDTSMRAYLEGDLSANIDPCIQNMKLSMIVIPDSSQTYLALGKAYELKEDYQSAIEWYKKGLDKTTATQSLLQSIAYDYIIMDQYCEAIPYYKDLVESDTANVTTMANLSVCFHNCGLYDSALTVYYEILALEPEKTSILNNVATYYYRKAGVASDSASKYQKEDNEEMAEKWRTTRKEEFDSALVYFKRSFETDPNDAVVAEQYGVVSALLGDCEEAIVGFGKATELQPERYEVWTMLADCHLTLQRFDEAVAAYEKVVELEPENIPVWEHLKDLYFEIGQNAKYANAEKKLNELKQ